MSKKIKTPVQALIELQAWQKNDLKVDLREVIPMISILMMSVAELTAKISSLERSVQGARDYAMVVVDRRLNEVLPKKKKRGKKK